MTLTEIIAALRRLTWDPAGRGPTHVDCVGFVLEYCRLTGQPIEPVSTPQGEGREACTAELAGLLQPLPKKLSEAPQTVILFANSKGVLMHCGVVLADGRLAHCTYGGVRFDNDTRLLERIGLFPVGAVPLTDRELLARVLAVPSLREPATIIMIVIAIVSLVLSIVLMPSLPAFGSQRGRYGFDGLVTQNTGEVPLPDVLGQVWCAGNLIYQQLTDKTGEVTDPALQKTSAVVVFCAGPVSDFGLFHLRINGNTYDSNVWFNYTDLSPPAYTTTGFYLDYGGLLLTTRAEVWDGTILSLDHRPSITLRDADLDIPGSRPEIVPVDLRAGYDRGFPIYGLNGCAYAVFRLVDSRKFSQFNVVSLVKGREFRLFDETGWLTATATAEDMGALWDGSRQYGVLEHPDVIAVSSLTVNGDPYVEMDASHQTGDVYRLNRERGYVEFLTPPPAAATVLVTYTYYTREWRANPAHHLLHLLTSNRYGKGLPADKIDWPSFEAARAYFAETVTTPTPIGLLTTYRYETHYTVDRRKPLLDHLQPLLDACTSVLLLSDGKLKLKPVSNTASVYSFDADSILAGSFKVTHLDKAEAANRLKVVFNDVDNFSAQTAVIVEDAADQAAREDEGNEGVVEKSLHFPAVTSWAQAHRLGMQRLAVELGRTWTVEFTTTLLGLALEPGDTIDLTHPAMPSWAGEQARIDEISHDEMDRLVIRASQYVELPYA